jgi:hypothetical protein
MSIGIRAWRETRTRRRGRRPTGLRWPPEQTAVGASVDQGSANQRSCLSTASPGSERGALLPARVLYGKA